ncbi:Outer membrane receptor proteins, mostly Fe transport [Daejeonella rubra]|uniref:Outer membrane receptor proteins, mostly Fe transport n=1 Tax=Daejeonella rubra TaxID=990371 RepID=A0A1G9Q876_9SPHI|nr:TonB-dependent receptor [Daejeonella rubra]SDM07139.1 Outer membrane receptor proteins, mostly Fe transport [Daejeonella rubra]
MKIRYTALTVTFLCFFLLTSIIQAQVKLPGSKVSGTILDEEKKILDFATISLLNARDSSLIRTAVSGLDGKFILQELPAGDYILFASMVGFQKTGTKIFSLNESSPVMNFPDFILKKDNKMLGEVTVRAVKPFIERKVDRLVVNVENSSVSAGSTALEVLQRAPGVTVDQNDNIAMQGKQGVLVMIDGKQTYMSNADVANLLRNMPSSQIETIELITNPSAKYDAAGNSGIINIKTKKSNSVGTNGTLTAGAGYGDNYRSNAGLTLNHRNKDINLFGNYNFSSTDRAQNMIINREVSNSITKTYFGQQGNSFRKNDSNNFKAGLDIFLNKSNTLGFLMNGYSNSGTELYNNTTFIGRSFSQADSSVIAINDGRSQYRNMAYNLNYKSVLDTSGKELSVDLDYSRFNANERTLYDNHFVNYIGPDRAPSLIKNSTPALINIKALKIDYSMPLNKTMKFEAGLKSSIVKTDNDFRFEEFKTNNWENDVRRSNQFVYDENVNAAYTNLNKQFKSTTVQLGLRAEQTNSKGNSITTSKLVERSYIDIFPSVFINQTLSKNHDMGLSYSRRIDRPSYDALNPFIYFLDQYTYNQGNPFLNPQYTNNYELSYNYKKTYNLTLNYSLTRDVITEVLLPDTAKKALFQTNENLDKQIHYGVNLTAPVTLSKWWSSSNNIQLYYLGFRSPNLRGQELNSGKVALQLNSQHKFIITSTLSAELIADYRSPFEYGTLKLSSQYGIDLGISKSLLKKRANIKLALSDVFDTRDQTITSAYTGLKYNLFQKNETRIGRISFSYRFGKSEIKPERRRSTGLEDEQSRIKN